MRGPWQRVSEMAYEAGDLAAAFHARRERFSSKATHATLAARITSATLSLIAAKLFPMLSCADLPRSLELYGGLFGGTETYRFPEQGDPAFVALTIGETSEIGLGAIATRPLHDRPQRPASGHRIELCVYVDDVDAVFEQVRERGFEAVKPPADMPWGERVAWIADPDGNLVMLTR